MLLLTAFLCESDESANSPRENMCEEECQNHKRKNVPTTNKNNDHHD